MQIGSGNISHWKEVSLLDTMSMVIIIIIIIIQGLI